ncbi:MAG: class I SAM-dependent methyltransferase [Acidimicrobiia bacterium]|nr:class I SAM-dependent methyltransferase [Acidimicrobiia bacterium]NNF63838.1 class I SAM-dependent methyltransferase [Acidimicrobiia bacterium]
MTTSGEPRRIAEYYDRWSPLFLQSFGSVFQAGLVDRMSPADSVVEMTSDVPFAAGDLILDAGCGIGGPAIALAQAHAGIEIEAITISPVQATMARDLIADAHLENRVRVAVGDYHALPYADAAFDHVILFEAIGYSHDPQQLLSELHRVLKPNGTVFVKDVFRRSAPLTADELAAMQEFDELWACVRSPKLSEIEATALAVGFVDVVAAPVEFSTERLLGAMFRFSSKGIEYSQLGEQFYRPDLRPPVVFGRVVGRRPA